MGLMNEYINRRMSANDLEQELLRLVGEYNRLQGTYLFVYSAAISKQTPGISLDMDDYYIVFDLLKNASGQNLDFYIETPGGSGEAAEEVVRFIRKKFPIVRFLVSGEAKSAGTIMTLSADEILMSESGSLGPIDAQVRMGRSTSSAYDYMEWVDGKRKSAARLGRLNPFDATMIAQISPGELEGVNNALQFAKDLVVEWLPKYKFKNWDVTETRGIKVTERLKKQRAKKIVEALINHKRWRSHGRSLKIDDIEKIGLKITRVDDSPELCEIVYRIQIVIKLLFNTTNTYKIFSTAEQKIFKNAASASVPLNPQPQSPDVANFEVPCPKCGTIHKIYGKFNPNPKIDTELQKQGYKPFPQDNKLICECGFEIDLSGMRNDIETRVGKKLVL